MADKLPSVTVTFAEGIAVYTGVDTDGDPKWSFVKPEQGRTGRPPKRLRPFFNSKRKHRAKPTKRITPQGQ